MNPEIWSNSKSFISFNALCTILSWSQIPIAFNAPFSSSVVISNTQYACSDIRNIYSFEVHHITMSNSFLALDIFIYVRYSRRNLVPYIWIHQFLREPLPCNDLYTLILHAMTTILYWHQLYYRIPLLGPSYPKLNEFCNYISLFIS